MHQHRELLAIDARIARIRDDIAAGRVSLESMSELDGLIEDRYVILRGVGISNPSFYDAWSDMPAAQA